MALDQKTTDSIKWSAIYNGAATAVESLIYQIAFSMFVGVLAAGIFNVGSLISSVISGVIGGAIIGFVLANWYPKIMDINKKYLGNKFNTLFKLLFYPYLIGALLSFLTSLGFATFLGVAPLISVAGTVLTRYFYAKLLTSKIGQYYPAVSDTQSPTP